MLHQPISRATPYSPAPANVRVAFQPLPILPAVTAAMATMPASVRSATLDELNDGAAQITAMATALVAKAGELLSPRMYRGFLRWSEAAIHSNVLCCDDDECNHRSNVLAAAVRSVASTDAQNEQDGFFKTYLIALEVADAPGFGPLEGDPTSTYSIDKLAIGLSNDLPWLSPLAEMIDTLSNAAWAASCSKSAYSLAIGEAMLAVFREAREAPAPLNMNGYDRFMRGPLIRWQKAYARYEEAADELATFDRDVHSPASTLWTEASEKVGDGSDTAAVEAEAAACAALDLAQERYDTLCSARYDALDELLRVPAPGSAELAIKLRLYSQDCGWGSEKQNSAGEQMTIDARRFGRLGAYTQADDALLTAYRQQRELVEPHIDGEGGDLTPDGEAAYFAVFDATMSVIQKARAATVEGVIAKLRVTFRDVASQRWSDRAILDPAHPEFRAGLASAGLPDRLLWSAIEDLSRIGGIALAEQGA